MRIGLVCVTSKTIRYYEQIGLLPQPDRAPNGYRTYAEQDAQRLYRSSAGLSSSGFPWTP